MSAVGRSRVRIAHSKTVKNGWQHETSVEFEWASGVDEIDDEADGRDAAEQIKSLLVGADDLGRAESARRTALDAGEAGS